MSTGNHAFDQKEALGFAPRSERFLRPANFPRGTPGKGANLFEAKNGARILVMNIMGRVFMHPELDDPFACVEQQLDGWELGKTIDAVFIDFHAEVTSEKRIMLMMLQNEVSMICGTHTHVGTDDLQIFNNTAYLTDIGLTGCRDNVIGMDKKIPIQKVVTGLGGHFEVPSSCKTILQMMITDINEDGKATNSFKIKKLCNNHEYIITKAMID